MILEDLVVRLVLDASNFVAGQKVATDSLGKTKDEAVKSGTAVERSALAASAGVEKLTRQFLALFALVTGGRELKQFVSDITAADAAVGRVARNIDMSGRALSTWQGAAVAAGGSAEGITSSMAGLSNAMQTAALTGENKLAPVFRALGVNLATTGGKARDIGAVMFDLNRKYNEMHIDPSRFSAMMKMVGLDDGTINLLERSQEEFRKLYDEQQKYAATSEDLDAAQQRQSGWRSLILASTSFGRTILTAVTPAIVDVMKGIQGWANANEAWIKTAIVEKVGEFVTWLKQLDWNAIGKGVQDFVREVGGMATALRDTAKEVGPGSALFTAFEVFGALLVGSKVLGAIGAVTSAVTAFGRLPVPPLLGSLLLNPAVLGSVGVAALLASGDPEKSVLAGGRPDVQPQDNDLGLPGVGDRPSDTSDAEAKAREAKAGAGSAWGSFLKAIHWGERLPKEAAGPPLPPTPTYAGQGEDGNALHRGDEATGRQGGFLAALKRVVGFGDDPRVREDLSDTEKNTRETRDILKRQADAAALGSFSGVTSSSGGLGGSGQHADGSSSPGAALRDRQYHGKGNFGEKGWWTPERQSHAIDVLMRDAGLTEDGAKALVSRWKFVESSGGPNSVNPHSGAEGIAQWLGSRKGDGSHGTFDEQLAKVARELNGKEARAKRLLNTPGREAAGASSFERAEGYNPATGEDNFTARTREGMKHVVHGVPAAPTSTPTVTVNGTPSHADAPIGDQAALDAQRRITSGQGRPGDRDLIEQHRRQQNAPAQPAAPSAYTKEQYDSAKRVAEVAKHVDMSKASADERRAVEIARPIIESYEKAHPKKADAPPKRGRAFPGWFSKGSDGETYSIADMRDPRFAPKPLDAAHQKLADVMRAGATSTPATPHHETVHHLLQRVLGAIRQADRIIHRPGGAPVPVTDHEAMKLHERTFGKFVGWGSRHPGDLDAARAVLHGGRAALDYHRTLMAGTTMHHSTATHTAHHYDYSTDTKIGSINVQTQAKDARQVADDLGPYLFQGRDARQANRGLA